MRPEGSAHLPDAFQHEMRGTAWVERRSSRRSADTGCDVIWGCGLSRNASFTCVIIIIFFKKWQQFLLIGRLFQGEWP